MWLTKITGNPGFNAKLYLFELIIQSIFTIVLNISIIPFCKLNPPYLNQRGSVTEMSRSIHIPSIVVREMLYRTCTTAKQLTESIFITSFLLVVTRNFCVEIKFAYFNRPPIEVLTSFIEEFKVWVVCQNDVKVIGHCRQYGNYQ